MNFPVAGMSAHCGSNQPRIASMTESRASSSAPTTTLETPSLTRSSSVVVGADDWAAAWAVDGQGRPAFAVVPGGEPQREMAMRFGVNLVMYVLTGNYKSDQVHVPAILERLGQ